MDTFWQHSVVLIRSSDPDEQSFGTGFVIYKDKQATYLLTCTHVVREVGGPGKLQINDIQARVVASSPEEGADLAILRIEGLLAIQPLPLRIAGENDESFKTAGFQRAVKQIVIRELHGILGKQVGIQMKEQGGRLKAWDLEITDKDLLQSGYSGSPIIDEYNHVIGVVNTLQGEGKRGVAISLEALEKIWPEMPFSLFVQSKRLAVKKLALLYTLYGHTECVNSVAISPDSHTLISGSDDKIIKVWDLSTGKELRILDGYGCVRSVAISADGHTLVSAGTDNVITVWDLSTGKELRTTSQSKWVNSVAISPDGQTLISGNDDKTIKVWDLSTGEELRTLTGHTKSVRSVAIGPDGHTLVSGSDDKTIKVWDLSTGKHLHTLPSYTGIVLGELVTGGKYCLTCVAISPAGQTLISGSVDKTIKVWDLSTGKQLHTLTGHTGYITSVAIDPDGQTLISGSVDKTIKVWDLSTGKELRTLTGHTGPIVSVAISLDGHTLVSAGCDKTIKVWGILQR